MTNVLPEDRHSPLAKALAQALPKDSCWKTWHLSTTPGITEALYYPPALKSVPDKRSSKPLKTYCEKHFLAVSIADPTTGQDVLVLGIEIYIYTTAFSTTIFVAKADSTGYLHLQPTPKGFSPIRALTASFLAFLVRHRRRPSRQLIINLFARAQSQYIFPGSVKNNKKHILDDRGLIKWWCRVLDPLLEHHARDDATGNWHRAHGYLIIPGLDTYEARAFIPKSEHAASSWSLGHPLELISPYTKDATNYGTVPPRCLIPTYPDDPKARFVEELEESTSEKARLLRGWKTPTTLDQFWEMMAFRQECSSGRMTGFIWLVFEPPLAFISSSGQHSNTMSPSSTTAPPIPTAPSGSTPGQADAASNSKAPDQSITSSSVPTSLPSNLVSTSAKPRYRKRIGKPILKGVIIPRTPRVKTHRAKFPDQVETPYYYWPEAGRGQVVLDDNGYKRAVELLLHLEFKNLEQAISSTSRWVSEVNTGERWDSLVTGEKSITEPSTASAPLSTVNNLTGLVQRKRKTETKAEAEAGAPTEGAPSPLVNTLGGGLVRKRIKD
ncbi:putative H3 K56 histone acetylation protein KAT11 [Rosellinia necatrix]|uniref:histone acetyltransferase n=1 Tax=Rosellinia necatrix TaxID=77044 RepID=A0A1W2TWB2_ROSNE|nr:putative H3 K56 histone acetylation protein KAT11 [Rosellinia necatrix]